MRLRDIRNIQNPYEAQENVIKQCRNYAFQCLSHEDAAIRVEAAQIIADCDKKLNLAKEHTTSFHFHILFCLVCLGLMFIGFTR